MVLPPFSHLRLRPGFAISLASPTSRQQTGPRAVTAVTAACRPHRQRPCGLVEGSFRDFMEHFERTGKSIGKSSNLYIYIIRYNYIYIYHIHISIYIYICIYPQSCIKMGIDMDWPGQVFVHCGWFFMMILDGIMRYLYDVFSWWFDNNLHRFYRNLYGIP